ncbi:GntR family transcriptional regulator [Labrys sp. WJW]|uniref:GntR family transcriptional regulator n=1 Tax=Labrys sp. WJW TaxID=1737983 RepID=UPI000830F1BF|nr:FCD domain-containing protein [Labrys sp. WJW]OCC03622.1 GntR family transcriptional regulator [Labrys sp. WJW]
MRSKSVYKKAYNGLLHRLADPAIECLVGPEARLAQELQISRTTLRTAIVDLQQAGILRERDVLRRPRPSDYFPEEETEQRSVQVERSFMEWILRADIRPGNPINVAQLSRQFSVSTTMVRQYLQQMRHYGLLVQRPNSTWIFRGITTDFAAELSEIRELFELSSARKVATLPADAPIWAQIRAIREEHVILLAMAETRFHDFSALDEKLHRLIYDASENRFVVEFYQIISIIFHYHYQWNKVDEKARNIAAIHQHLDYIDALLSRDVGAVERTCRAHLAAARETMRLSIGNSQAA